MKVIEEVGLGTCDACEEAGVVIHLVTFEATDKSVLLCRNCLDWTRDVLRFVDVKEAGA